MTRWNSQSNRAKNRQVISDLPFGGEVAELRENIAQRKPAVRIVEHRQNGPLSIRQAVPDTLRRDVTRRPEPHRDAATDVLNLRPRQPG